MKRMILTMAACLVVGFAATGCRTSQGGTYDDYQYDEGYDRMNEVDPARPNPDANPVLDRTGPNSPWR